MKLDEFFKIIMPLLLSKTVDKIEKEIEEGGEVKAYWAGTVLRIDIKPK